MFYSSGIRRRELSGLQLDDVDVDRQTLIICQGKGKKDRLIPIGNRALQWIARYLEEARPLLLVIPTNKPCSSPILAKRSNPIR